MSSGIMNFKNIVEQILRAIILTGHTFKGQCTARLRSLHTAIGGSSKDVLYVTLCVFQLFRAGGTQYNSSQTRLAGALKETAICKRL